MHLRKLLTAKMALAMAIGTGATLVVLAPIVEAAGPRPPFQLPFPCGQQWRLDSYDSAHAPALDMVKEPDQHGTNGAPLIAPAAGRVNQSFYHERDDGTGAGNVIQIDHGGGWFTTYIHLQSRSVSADQQVARGQEIGRVGATGSTSNGHPHLHFELAIDANSDGSASWGFAGSERVPAWFNGVQYGTAPGQTYRNVTSHNSCPLPPPELAPAMLKSTSDGGAAIYRWIPGDGAFRRATDWTSSGTYTLDLVGDRVAAGDVNGDRRDDVVAAKQNPDGTFVLQVWLNGVDVPQTWFQSEGNTNLDSSVAGRFVVGDWNGDGDAEPAMLKSTSDGRATIYRWTSTGSSFQRITDWTSSGAYTLDLIGNRVAAGDVNDDGKDDIVAAKQNPDGTFVIQVWLSGVQSPQTWYQSDGNTNLDSSVAGRFVVGDWNGDGDAEPAMLKSTSDGRATIYRWASTGDSFQRSTDWTSSGTYSVDLVGDRVAAGDVNGDRRDDVVAAKQNPDGTFVIQVWLGGADNPQSWYQSDGNTSLDATVAGRFVVGDWNGIP